MKQNFVAWRMNILFSEASLEPTDFEGEFGEGSSGIMHENCPCSETNDHHQNGRISQELKDRNKKLQ